MTRIILIRHGQSEANKACIFAGHTDVQLTELGKAQAAAAASYLRQHEQIDAVYASDLSRAMSTARPTAEAFGLPLHPDSALREVFAGDWEGVSFPELDRNPRFCAHRNLWRTDLQNALCTGGETVAEVYARVVEAVTRIAQRHDGETVLVATHWTPVMAMICKAQGLDFSEIGSCTEPKNASINILRFENGAFSSERLNITEHLDGIEAGSHI